MKRLYTLISALMLFLSTFAVAQENTLVKGIVIDARTKMEIADSKVSIEALSSTTLSDANGNFRLETNSSGNHILEISAPEYVTKRIPIFLEGKHLDLGKLFLEKDITLEEVDNLISLTDSEVFDDAISVNSPGLLQATRDVFLNRAAFDFGQVFFRVRGYDSQHGKVLINGIPMNKLFDGRPQWNNWGGLNDVTRNQQFTNGIAASDYTFGGILGNTNIDTRPSGLRPGLRFSSSASNRTYAGRLMTTYTSRNHKNDFAYSLSGSRRWAKQGYIDGTLYDAFSFFAALEYQLNKKNSIQLTGIFAQNRRGRSSAISTEVFDLVGKQYNPYWGIQNGKIRNARERTIAEPMLSFNHYYEAKKFQLNTGIAYQFGTNSRSRLGYFNAPNPDPTYYRYLPSYFINSSIGANFSSANTARDGFIDRPQLNWERLYAANASEQAAYVLYDDQIKDKQLNLNSIANWSISQKFQIDFGTSYKSLNSNNYAAIGDLLGAEYLVDVDPFSNTRNDLSSDVLKKEAEIFSYNYQINASFWEAFTQLKYSRNKWDAFMAGQISTTNYQRIGLFENERFAENSLGESKALLFSNYGFKGSFSYKITGRHWLSLQGMYGTSAPVMQNVFINPRENNAVVPQIQNELLATTDLNYFIRMPKLTGRVTGFYTRFQNTTDINFFYVDTGIGSDFVQEVLTDLDKLHMGIELGLSYQLSSSVQLSTVAALGKYLYASDPSVAINFDTAGAEDELINLDGYSNLGIAQVKDYKLAQGPQQAFSFGIDYRDPKYWWVSAKMNFLAENYASISTINRTQSFLRNPETGEQFPDATPERVAALLKQNSLDDIYLLNLVGGKSWLKKGKYISIFASINNLFNTAFRTGGYEQSRNGNFGQLQSDMLSGNPSFGPKFWYGYGRTYFLNLAYSF